MRPSTLSAPLATVPAVGSTGLRWGISLALSGELAEPGAVAEVAATAEAAGWDGVFVWDHLWNHTLEPFADPWVTLAAVAVATERVRIGPLVTPLPRRRPQVVAQQATTLDRLSGGRVVLGLGLGHDGYGEYSAFDEPLTDDRSRAAALDRGIELLLPALAGGPVPRAGGRSTTHAGRQQPRVPIWVAGRPGVGAGPRRLRRHGLEGLALFGVDTWTPADVAAVVEATGRQPGQLDIVLTGGDQPDPAALAEAGATWCVVERGPGVTRAEAQRLAASRP
jgi:alkanesulfonate monooxygenase SsuD/methylene tetrahydromethanopterin reductase-like flavin-dependent oxidoreductase (luciferase family)